MKQYLQEWILFFSELLVCQRSLKHKGCSFDVFLTSEDQVELRNCLWCSSFRPFLWLLLWKSKGRFLSACSRTKRSTWTSSTATWRFTAPCTAPATCTCPATWRTTASWAAGTCSSCCGKPRWKCRETKALFCRKCMPEGGRMGKDRIKPEVLSPHPQRDVTATFRSSSEQQTWSSQSSRHQFHQFLFRLFLPPLQSRKLWFLRRLKPDQVLEQVLRYF